jgi:predicted nuclease of restriction endonuclease-like RecB superfamily
VLTKDLLRVSRAGGGYHPQFTDRADRPLAARVIGVYQGHVGESRADLDAALEDLEREANDFKLVRGFAKLVEREATFETRSEINPERARSAAFAAAESVGVVTDADRERALSRAADRLDAPAETVARSLYADLDERQVLTEVDVPWDPADLCAQYDLSLAQTVLFDATELRVRSSDPKALVSAVKRLRLLYEIRKTDGSGTALSEREVRVTGPDSLFRRTRRYGTRFARLLRTVTSAGEWDLAATIDDRGTERELHLTHDDLQPPGTEPVVEIEYDSTVEADFAARFAALDLDWALVREPEPLETGARVMIPDFAFEWQYGVPDVATGDSGARKTTSSRGFRVFFEIMGFWTPEYVAKKLAQIDELEDVELLVAVDESLGVGEDLEARDARAIPYSKTVRVRDVRDALREYEDRLNEASAAALPDELVPAERVILLSALAAEHGVSESAIEGKEFPDHELVGRTLIRPAVLSALETDIEPGTALSAVEERLGEEGIDDASAVLSKLGYRVEWDGLAGGTVRERE